MHLVLGNVKELKDRVGERIYIDSSCLSYEEEKRKQESVPELASNGYGKVYSVRNSDSQDSNELCAELIAELTPILNRTHKTTYDERLWKLLIGDWLRHYIDVVINRTEALYECDSKFTIDSYDILANSKFELAPRDKKEFIDFTNDPLWNIGFYNLLIDETCLFFEARRIPTNLSLSPSIKRLTGSKRSKLKKAVYYCLERLEMLLSKATDAIFILPYTSNLTNVKAQLRLKQVPILRRLSPLDFPEVATNEILRSSLTKLITVKRGTQRANIVRRNIFTMFPKVYLESFDYAVTHSPYNRWPNKAKMVFTSNAFHDDVFNIWLVRTIFENGTKYIVGQHGSNYGTDRFLTPTIEEDTSDYFLSWGWSNNVKTVKCYNFKKKNYRAFDWLYSRLRDKTKLLSVQLHRENRVKTWDVHYQHRRYFEDQKLFFDSLNPEIKDALVVRMHPFYSFLDFADLERWHDIGDHIQFSDQGASFESERTRSRLTVFSYDATALLENISINAPSVAFWQNGLAHVTDEARYYYELLLKARVLHLNPISAANHVNSVWLAPEDWWEDTKTQKLIDEFRSEYCNPDTRSENLLDVTIRDLVRT